MTNIELVNKLKDITENYKTLYVMGGFGAPLTPENKKYYTSNYDYNKNPERTAMINYASEDTFAFDCSCLIKGVLWGWCGDKNAEYGGAKYASNNVPDINADRIFDECVNVSSDFTELELGEALWLPDHIGIYIGNGLAVESTPKWSNGVQYTACNQDIKIYNRRDWDKHGYLPYVEYIS